MTTKKQLLTLMAVAGTITCIGSLLISIFHPSVPLAFLAIVGFIAGAMGLGGLYEHLD